MVLVQAARSAGKKDEQSTCPGSTNACAGDQCCPGINATDGQTFPCPTAHPTYGSCEVDWAVCPGSGNRCMGNQCCPGIPENGGKTFPCPIADPAYSKCTTNEIPMVLVQAARSAGKKDEQSTCPGSTNACAGDQCCPGIAATGEKTFPCPTAHPTYGKCAVDWAECPGSGNQCRGNQCCPGIPESGGKTFPCHIADTAYSNCT